jgi:indolepyruvate ferredoxin oxidoreductase, beta subunit
MKKDIILSGVGGQGILSIAAVIGSAALSKGLYLKQAEVHGMSQRGGDVHSNLRISDKAIHSDLIPFGQADLIISVEPMESLRYLPLLAKTGWLISNSTPYVNIPNYPEIEDVYTEIRKVKHHILIDAESIAKDLGFPRSANMVILGAAMPYLEIEQSEIENAIANIFKSKGQDIIDQNITALLKGKEVSDVYAVAGK